MKKLTVLALLLLGSCKKDDNISGSANLNPPYNSINGQWTLINPELAPIFYGYYYLTLYPDSVNSPTWKAYEDYVDIGSGWQTVYVYNSYTINITSNQSSITLKGDSITYTGTINDPNDITTSPYNRLSNWDISNLGIDSTTSQILSMTLTETGPNANGILNLTK
ncbi:hypothetical protein PQZ52_01085 [Flavobacteriales bacterium]|nr:hypothetical protein [Flavobacteriales bacterium]